MSEAVVYVSRVAAAHEQFVQEAREAGASEQWISEFDDHAAEVLFREFSKLWGLS